MIIELFMSFYAWDGKYSYNICWARIWPRILRETWIVLPARRIQAGLPSAPWWWALHKVHSWLWGAKSRMPSDIPEVPRRARFIVGGLSREGADHRWGNVWKMLEGLQEQEREREREPRLPQMDLGLSWLCQIRGDDARIQGHYLGRQRLHGARRGH